MTGILDQFSTFLLIFVRLASFFVTAPIFSYRTIPAPFKIGLSVFFAWVIMLTLKAQPINVDGVFVLLILKEALIGLSIGFVAGLIFYALQIAGAFIDLQMGLAIANIMDPQSGVTSPLTGQYFYIIAMLFLLTVNGHYLLLDGIYYSYQLIPIDQMTLHLNEGELAYQVLQLFLKMFIIAFQMALPVVGSLFLVDVGIGIIARTVPQVNVFVVGLPLKIFISFFIILLVIPVYILVIKMMVSGLAETMKAFIQVLGGST